MTRFEYWLSSLVLRLLGRLLAVLPMAPRRVVLATARVSRLEGNLLYLDRAMRARFPDLDYVHLLEPYGYGLLGKLAYMGRVVRGMYHLSRARLFIVDNAYLPIHVAPHRPGTKVIQVWHATGALKRFGADTTVPLREPERTFLHRHYDAVVVSAESARLPYSRALRTPVEHVHALGTPRTDFLYDSAALAEARARVLDGYPQLVDRKVVLYAPTFRGRGPDKRPAEGLDPAALRRLLPQEYALVLKSHPNLDPQLVATGSYDAVINPAAEIDEVFAATDVFVTDYSSSIFEWAVLRRPLVLLVPDLADYERDPGLYLDYRTEMIGTRVVDTNGVAAAILGNAFDLTGYEAFVERYLGPAQGRASERFVDHFLGNRPAEVGSSRR
jgi:CDP-glycerol glycerophosphotransferase (TagB/SpsB family)